MINTRSITDNKIPLKPKKIHLFALPIIALIVLCIIPLSHGKPASDNRVFQDRLKDGSQGPKMVVIPSGDFKMGSSLIFLGVIPSEKPYHEVVIDYSFAVSQNEVTVGEYRTFVQATNYKTEVETHERPDGCFRFAGMGGYYWDNPGFAQTDKHPVVCISWNDANAYTQWLSAQTGQRYRLLSESEWEYTARAGSDTMFSWGDDIDEKKANCEDCGNAFDGQLTVPVASFAANAFGIYDMHGNAEEWVEDIWHNNYDNAPSDGSAWVEVGKDKHMIRRIARGGSFAKSFFMIRSASRFAYKPQYSWDYIGFRIARDLD